ncbi:MAG TPA: hypothetical protein VGM51_11645 [Armatimonadota bacterium]|jgi:hypothetical protein
MFTRRPIWIFALGLILALATVSARAAERTFNLYVQADGVNLGTAAAKLTVADAGSGQVTWKLTDGVFTELPNPDGKLKWNDDILTANGKAKNTDTVALRDFDITVQQSTGVDVVFRFRLSATLAEGDIKSVAIEQVK